MVKRFLFPLFVVVGVVFVYLHYLNPVPVSITLVKGKAPLRITVSKFFILSFALGFAFSSIYFFILFVFRRREFSRERKSLASELRSEKLATEALCEHLLGREGATSLLEGRAGSPGSCLALGLILWREGRFEDAVKALERGESGILYTLCGASLYALALRDSGNIDGAISFLERATSKKDLSGDSFILRLLRDLYIRAERFEDALSVAKKVYKYTKDRRDEMAIVGVEYEILKRKLRDNPKTVAKRSSKIFKSYPSFLPAYLLAADAYEAMGKDGKEKELFERLVKDVGPNPEVLKVVESYYMKKGNPDGILEIYRKVLASSDDPDILLLYGELCESLELLDEALEVYRKIKSKGMTSYFLSLREVLLLKKMGRKDEALGAFEEVSRELERSFFPYFECEVCGKRSKEWRDFCEVCLSWGSFRFRSRIGSSLQ